MTEMKASANREQFGDWIQQSYANGGHFTMACPDQKFPLDWTGQRCDFKKRHSLNQILLHVKAGKPTGVIPSTLRLLCLDFDFPHDLPEADWPTADALLAELKRRDIKHFVEPSRTPGRLHIWVFVDKGFTKPRFGKVTLAGVEYEVRYDGGHTIIWHQDAFIRGGKQPTGKGYLDNPTFNAIFHIAANTKDGTRQPPGQRYRLNIDGLAAGRNSWLLREASNAYAAGDEAAADAAASLVRDRGLPEQEIAKVMTRARGYGEERRPAPPAAAEPVSNKPIRFLTAEEMTDYQTPEFLIPDQLPATGLAFLYGDSNIGKTFIALNWALSLARLDYPTLYIAAEDGHAIGARIRAWITHHKGELSPLSRFYPDDFDLMDESTCKAFAAAAGKHGLIVIDTLARSMWTGDENNASDVRRALANVRLLQQAVEGLVLIVHHIGKDRKRGMRGSSALRAGADVAIEATFMEADESIRLRWDKARHFARPADDFMRLIPAGDSQVAVKAARPEGGGLLTAPGLSDNATVLYALIPPGESIKTAAWKRESGFADSTFKRARNELLAANLIKRVGPAEYRTVTRNEPKRATGPTPRVPHFGPSDKNGKNGGDGDGYIEVNGQGIPF